MNVFDQMPIVMSDSEKNGGKGMSTLMNNVRLNTTRIRLIDQMTIIIQ